jgi:hypothetical protein
LKKSYCDAIFMNFLKSATLLLKFSHKQISVQTQY